MLIAFEGGDRVGKSTQCSLLLNYLESKGIPCKGLKYPGIHSNNLNGKIEPWKLEDY